MSSLYLWDGMLLAVDGALAAAEDCCCRDECGCPDPVPPQLYAQFDVTGCDNAVIDGCVSVLEYDDGACGDPDSADHCWVGTPEGDTVSGCGDVLSVRVYCVRGEDGEEDQYKADVDLCNVLGVGTVTIPLTIVSCEYDDFELSGWAQIDVSCCQGTLFLTLTAQEP